MVRAWLDTLDTPDTLDRRGRCLSNVTVGYPAPSTPPSAKPPSHGAFGSGTHRAFASERAASPRPAPRHRCGRPLPAPGHPGGQPALPALRATASPLLTGMSRSAPRVRSHWRFRNKGTEYVSNSGIKWMRCGTKRQCDRALAAPPWMACAGTRRACSRGRRSGAHMIAAICRQMRVFLCAPSIFHQRFSIQRK